MRGTGERRSEFREPKLASGNVRAADDLMIEQADDGSLGGKRQGEQVPLALKDHGKLVPGRVVGKLRQSLASP